MASRAPQLKFRHVDGIHHDLWPEFRRNGKRMSWPGLAYRFFCARRIGLSTSTKALCPGPGGDSEVCGAGHLCCGDPSEPPLHDHFLSPDDCPQCRALGESDE